MSLGHVAPFGNLATREIAMGWYERRDELQSGMVFTTLAGDLVKLDRQVPGDGTKWYIAEWWDTGWAYMDSTIEPGELANTASEPKR